MGCSSSFQEGGPSCRGWTQDWLSSQRPYHAWLTAAWASGGPRGSSRGFLGELGQRDVEMAFRYWPEQEALAVLESGVWAFL